MIRLRGAAPEPRATAQASVPRQPVLVALAVFALATGAGSRAGCLTDPDCDDGLFCNGSESCDDGSCRAGVDACPGRLCVEDGDVCTGNVSLQPRPGQPLHDLTREQLDRFEAGRDAFDDILVESAGLGPVFNQTGCGRCHTTPLGGSGSSRVTRFGVADPKGGFDPLAALGGSLLQDTAIRPECAETVPPESNLSAMRITTSTLGLGLVEAIADADLAANATTPPGPVSGRAHMVLPLESPGTARVGRMGWKSQVATLLTFSADAALNELGLTNRLLAAENAPNGDLVRLAACDAYTDPEDMAGPDGFDFIDRVTDFQRFLAPPPQAPRSGLPGEALFESIGCADCHVAAFTTDDDPLIEDPLGNRSIRPYSDFLLHDMGQTADFIAQGDASQRELRTPPLWGLRFRASLWHDGRFGGSLDSRARAAIAAHNVLGSEARVPAQAFAALPAAGQASVIAFLDSLGRAEFDMDGDGLVGAADFAAFQACHTGPGPVLVPAAPCSIADPDQDGDVDDDDFDLFVAAAEGLAGAVPDDAPLVVGRSGDDMLDLAWAASCSAADVDYAVYEGSLGDFASHAALACSTGGLTATTIRLPVGSVYYLVVPLNGFREGSYGTDSAAAPRPSGAGACFPRAEGACD